MSIRYLEHNLRQKFENKKMCSFFSRHVKYRHLSDFKTFEEIIQRVFVHTKPKNQNKVPVLDIIMF